DVQDNHILRKRLRAVGSRRDGNEFFKQPRLEVVGAKLELLNDRSHPLPGQVLQGLQFQVGSAARRVAIVEDAACALKDLLDEGSGGEHCPEVAATSCINPYAVFSLRLRAEDHVIGANLSILHLRDHELVPHSGTIKFATARKTLPSACAE